MAVLKTKFFRSETLSPKDPPDGTSLEELMNVFLASMPISSLADVTTEVTHGQSAKLVYTGTVVFQV